MSTPTPVERETFVWMQGRLIELLLRHDIARFLRTFDELVYDPRDNETAHLARVRRLAVLIYLREDFFGSILPQIKNRLSFESPRETQIESPPVHGRVDWTRTAARAWQHTPTEPPLEVITRQRRRDFATPENLLTVVTLLEYAQAVQTALYDEANVAGESVLSHPLYDILDTIEREWIFPQFAGLRRQGEDILTEHHKFNAEQLEEMVEGHLLPGRNSAYDDLLAWRHKLRSLRLMEQTKTKAMSPMLGANPARDNYLYQVWIFYEFGDFLTRTLGASAVTWNTPAQQLSFTWGSASHERRYDLRHDQAVRHQWLHTPGLRPDFYIVPADASVVQEGKTTYWSEPGFILDAKYYRPRESAQTPAGPIKRMIADIHLAGVQHSALLFAFHGTAPVNDESTELVESGNLSLSRPSPYAQRTIPDTKITSYQITPARMQADALNDDYWRTLLNYVHDAIGKKIEIGCHGVFADTLTATANGSLWATESLLRRFNGVSIAADDVVFCPKPHIGAWRVDVVSASHDCCQNMAVCHIKGLLKNIQPPRRLQQLEDVAEAIRNVSEDFDDEKRALVATQQVKVIVQRYATLLQPNLAEYRQRVQDNLYILDFDVNPLLTDEQRNTLALAEFLHEQTKSIKAENYAGPLLLYAGVLEEVIGATLAPILNRLMPRLKDDRNKELTWTLGNFAYLHRKPLQSNSKTVYVEIVDKGHWQTDLNGMPYPFTKWLEAMNVLADIRNKAAHEAKAPYIKYEKFYQAYRGSVFTGPGALNGLLRAWK